MAAASMAPPPPPPPAPSSSSWEEAHHASLGFSGILSHSASVFSSRSKLFFSLSLTLTLPLCFVVLAHNLAIDPIVSRINEYQDMASYDTSSSLRDRITSYRIRLAILLAAYLLLVLIFGLLSTAATVYSVACIYTKRSLTYRKVLSVVPKVWRRLLVTFLWAFVFVFFLVGTFLVGALAIYFVFYPLSTVAAVVLWWIISIIFLAVLFHFTCVFSLASVVSVLEHNYGLSAIKKSGMLIKGRRLLPYSLYALYLIFGSVVVIAFDFAEANVSSVALSVVLAFIFAILLAAVEQMGMIVFTILYFACKAFHHESIDVLALSEHLGAYSGEYVNLRASVQMENMA